MFIDVKNLALNIGIIGGGKLEIKHGKFLLKIIEQRFMIYYQRDHHLLVQLLMIF